MTLERVLTIEEAPAWRDALPASASVFGSVEYAGILQEHTSYSARLFVSESADSLIVYPFFLRPVNTLTFAVELPNPFWDTVTPEYTGPLERRSHRAETRERFARTFSRYCERQGIVAEFIHLHAFDRRTEYLEPSCVGADRDIVYVNLELSEEQLWCDSFSHNCRRNIRRAQRRGVQVFRATTPAHVREFHRVYIDTMDHNQALKKYYFPLEFFLAFFEWMPDNALFLLAEYEGRVVAGGLYLYDEVEVYAHLAGSDRAFQQVCPANAEVYEAILWAKRQGKQRFILGGGYAPDDGVLRFKAGFSPLRAGFCVYRRIHLPEVYESLCRAWSNYHHSELPANGFFPAYRTVPAAACPNLPAAAYQPEQVS